MKNNSGIYPKGDRVLVKPEPMEDKTEGGIIIALESKEKYGNAQVYGHLVDHGSDAWDDYKLPFAEIGERVMFAKHGGVPVVGKDGEKYRILNDTDITATLDDGVTYFELKNRESMRKSQ